MENITQLLFLVLWVIFTLILFFLDKKYPNENGVDSWFFYIIAWDWVIQESLSEEETASESWTKAKDFSVVTWWTYRITWDDTSWNVNWDTRVYVNGSGVSAVYTAWYNWAYESHTYDVTVTAGQNIQIYMKWNSTRIVNVKNARLKCAIKSKLITATVVL
jgi:hypothetical protein